MDRSDSFSIPKWAVGCALGFTVAFVVAGAGLFVWWLLTPVEPTNTVAETVSEDSEAETVSEDSEMSDLIADVIREGTGNSGPKLDSPISLADFQFPSQGAGDNNVTSVVFLDPDGNEFRWQMTMTHPDKTFQSGNYQMKISGQNLTGFSDDTCEVTSGVLTCSFMGRSPRYSKTNVQVAVTKDKKVVTSFWGQVSEQKSSGSSKKSDKDKDDHDKDKSQSGSSDDHGQTSSSTKKQYCMPINEPGMEPYGGTVSPPIVSEPWEAGKPLKVEFDLSEEAGEDFPTETSGYILVIGDYTTEQCRGKDPRNPNRLTCEIDLPEGYGHSVQDLVLAFGYIMDEEENVGIIGMCGDDVEIPEQVAGGGNDAGIDCSVFHWMEIDVAWPEWNACGPLPITFKFPGAVPGLESSLPGEWHYIVNVGGEYESDNCAYLGYHGKLHCSLGVDKRYSGSVQSLELWVYGCGPIYYNEMEYMPFMEGGCGTDDHHDDDQEEDHHDDDHHH